MTGRLGDQTRLWLLEFLLGAEHGRRMRGRVGALCGYRLPRYCLAHVVAASAGEWPDSA